MFEHITLGEIQALKKRIDELEIKVKELEDKIKDPLKCYECGISSINVQEYDLPNIALYLCDKCFEER